MFNFEQSLKSILLEEKLRMLKANTEAIYNILNTYETDEKRVFEFRKLAKSWEGLFNKTKREAS